MRLSHKAIILVSVPLVFEIIFVAYLATQLKISAEDARRQERSKTIITEADSLSQSLLSAGYSYTIYRATGSERYLAKNRRALAHMTDSLNTLKALTSGDRIQSTRVAQMERFGHQILQLTSAINAPNSPGGMVSLTDIATQQRQWPSSSAKRSVSVCAF